MATRTTAEPNDWETVEPNDWETVPATQSSSPSLSVDFSNKSGQGTYPMWDTAGKKHDVPYGEVSKAQKLKYQFDTNKMQNRGGLDPETAYLRDRAADANTNFSRMSPDMSPEESQARSAQIEANAPLPMRIIGGIAKGGGTLARPVLDVTALGTGSTPQEIDEMLAPRSTAEKVAKYTTVAAPIIASGVAAPAATALALGAGTIGSTVTKEGAKRLGATPQQAEVAGDVGGLITGFGGGKVGSLVDRSYVPWLKTPVSAKSSLASALARTPSSNKNLIVQDIADDIAEPMRYAAANNPEIAKVVLGNDPKQALAAQMNLFEKASQYQDNVGDAVGELVADRPVDPTGATAALRPTETSKNLFPEDAEWLETFRGKLNKLKTLGELNDARKELNDRSTSLYKAATDDAGSVRARAYKQAADNIRNLYYDKVQEITGHDLRGIKKTQANILNAMDAFAENKAKLTREHQLHTEPKSFKQTVANVAGGSMDPATIGKRAVAGWVQEKVGGSQLQQIHNNLKELYAGLPEADKEVPVTPQPEPSRLNPPKYPQLPAKAGEWNADDMGSVDNGTVPNQSSGFHVKPGESAYQHEQVIPGNTPPATGPTVTEQPTRHPQLGAGEPGKVGSKYVEQVGARPSSPNRPPAVNPSTAVERVTPKQGGTISIPNAGSFRVIEARPNGEMVILHTRQLPAPEARAGLPSQASPSTVTPSTPQLPPVGYKFTGPDGIVREVTKVSKLGTVTLKEVKGASAVGPRTKELQLMRSQPSQ